ncbi:MAG TPA: hypothetical protein VGW10_14900 [Solirubrobacteraceae bacterium]|nr:hypothetical protein [Solirubrobacteraceae bacterium]
MSVEDDELAALGRPPGSWRPYAPDSPFNRPVGARPRIDPRSDAIVRRLTARPPDALLTFDESDPAAAAGDYARPLYWADADDPRHRVLCTDFGGDCAISGEGVRIPAEARPAAGEDGHLTVVDGEWEWSFFRVQRKDAATGQLVVGNGDRIRVDGDGLDGGGGAARFGGLAGRIRWEALRDAIRRRGALPHALFMTVACARAGAFVPPATGAERKRACADQRDRPEMGRRFWLAMRPDEVEALDVPEWLKVIARTMATHGAFVGDQGGDNWGLQFESPQGFLSFGVENPFALYALQKPGGVVDGNGSYAYRLREGVPWAGRLRALAAPGRP